MSLQPGTKEGVLGVERKKEEDGGGEGGRRGREGVGREEEVEPARGKDGEFMYAAAHGPRRQC